MAYHQLNEEFPGRGFEEIECIVRDLPEDGDDAKRDMSLGENIMHVQMSGRDRAW